MFAPSVRRPLAVAALLLTLAATPALAGDALTAAPAGSAETGITPPPAPPPASDAVAPALPTAPASPGAPASPAAATAETPAAPPPASPAVETPGAPPVAASPAPDAPAPPAAASPAPDAPVRTAVPSEPRARVEYHVRQAERIAAHFRGVVNHACPRFATPQQWDAYVDAETDRMVLLVAHLDQAWTEAKRTGDDDVRREAKAPRRRLSEHDARQLLDKLQTCAERNGTELETGRIVGRIQREAPRRQVEIALPQ